MNSEKAWEKHYTTDRSILVYPDEALVRMIKPCMDRRAGGPIHALDAGCGTGRHVKLLMELGAQSVTGLDTSFNALKVCRTLYAACYVQGTITRLPFRDSSYDAVVAWGSLHYTMKENLPLMLAEIRRVMKDGGRLFGTLRNSRDTHLKKGVNRGNDTWITNLSDIENSLVCFYNETELREALGIFREYSFGMMERSVMGDISSIISHWFFWAEK